MSADTVIQIVSTLGFPIAAYCAMFWHMVKSEENHKMELAKMAEALNGNSAVIAQNTTALTRLLDSMDNGQRAEG